MFVYAIECVITGKIYIEKSKHPDKRWKEHLGSKRDDVLYRAIRKYGSENFSFWILQALQNNEEALLAERWWISYLKSMDVQVMNIHPGGRGGRNHGWKHSEETKRKLSRISSLQLHSDQTRQKMSKAHSGRRKSHETRKKMSAYATARSTSHLEKISKSLTGRKRPDQSGTRNSQSISKDVALKILNEDRKISSNKLATKYNVDYMTVYRIRKGTHWVCQC